IYQDTGGKNRQEASIFRRDPLANHPDLSAVRPASAARPAPRSVAAPSVKGLLEKPPDTRNSILAQNPKKFP
ncbi:hypothetical protein, partial [Poseidonocella sp. HB161398]|uniref:hypothetical protein n=1 Tax=Poseidonocella sp. HB161398 TaxID=2320855 RepID=UPI001980E2FD